MGQNDMACEVLEKALDSFRTAPQLQQEQALIAFLLGAAFYRQDQFQRAKELADALKWSARLGYDQFMVVAGRRFQDFVAFAEQSLPDNLQLKSIVQRVKQAPIRLANLREKNTPTEFPAMHLEIRGFGVGQVWLNGELIPRSKWRSSGSLALFFFIIQNDGVRKEEIGLEFWPEFSTSKISSNFHATLWRVRKALGEREIISFSDKKYFLNPSVTIWYDVSEFENHVQCAHNNDLSKTQRADHLRQAIDLYLGDYLEDVFMDWSLQLSDELKRLFIQSLTLLAELEAERHHFESAISLYEKVLGEDPYRDSSHLALMQCLVSVGLSSSAKSHYHKYGELLEKELGTRPSQELKDFYDKL